MVNTHPPATSNHRSRFPGRAAIEAMVLDSRVRIHTAATDAELVQRSQDGDLDAFDILVDRYRGRVYALVMNLIHNDADAWDLTQDTFVKAWTALPGFEGRANFFTWLYRISHNLTYDWIRRRSSRGGNGRIALNGELDPDAIEPGAPTAPRQPDGPEAGLERSELRRRLDDAISHLTPEHREVILLKEIEGLRYREIADTVGCSVGTVMSRLHYARKKLQEHLTDLQP